MLRRLIRRAKSHRAASHRRRMYGSEHLESRELLTLLVEFSDGTLSIGLDVDNLDGDIVVTVGEDNRVLVNGEPVDTGGSDLGPSQVREVQIAARLLRGEIDLSGVTQTDFANLVRAPALALNAVDDGTIRGSEFRDDIFISEIVGSGGLVDGGPGGAGLTDLSVKNVELSDTEFRVGSGDSVQLANIDQVTLRGVGEGAFIDATRFSGEGGISFGGRGDGNDTVLGSQKNDQLDGAGGNDILFGGPGNDSFMGGEGADLFLDLEPGEQNDAAVDLVVFALAQPPEIKPGERITQRLQVLNNGPDFATNISVRDAFNGPVSGFIPLEQEVPANFFPNVPPNIPTPLVIAPSSVIPIPVELINRSPTRGASPGLATYTAVVLPGPERDLRRLNNQRDDSVRIVGPTRASKLVSDLQSDSTLPGASGTDETSFGNTRTRKVAANGTSVGLTQNSHGGTVNRPGNSAILGDPIHLDEDGTGFTANSEIFDVSISDNGSVAVFNTEATNLSDLPNILPTRSQVYVRDIDSPTVELISVSHDGTEAGNNESADDNEFVGASIDATGRFVVFQSRATNLTAPGVKTTTQRDIFLRDRELGVTRLVSRTPAGSPGNTDSVQGHISANGRTVLFHSRATDLVPGFDNNGTFQLYAYDTETELVTPVSVASDGVTGGNQRTDANTALISDDGNFVLFITRATNLVDGVVDPGNLDDVFLRDLRTGATTLVSKNQANEPVGGSAEGLSADGAFALFVSFNGSGIDPSVTITPSRGSLFRYDAGADTASLVNVTPDGTGDGGSTSRDGSISDDGRYVAFRSSTLALTAEDVTKGGEDFDEEVFVRDMTNGLTTLITINADGTASGNGSATEVFISGDGNRVVYESDAGNLAAGATDDNGVTDLFSSSRHRTLFFEVTDALGDGILTLTRSGNDIQLFSSEAEGDGLVASASREDVIGVQIIGLDDQDDTLVIDLSGGLLDLLDGVTFEGGAGGFDSLEIFGASLDTVTYQAEGSDFGAVLLQAGGTLDSISYTGLEPIFDETEARHRKFEGLPLDFDVTSFDIRLFDAEDGLAGIDSNQQGLFEEVIFEPPTETLAIAAGRGDDIVRVESVPEGFDATILLDGQDNGERGDEVIVSGGDVTDDGERFTGSGLPEIVAINFETRTIDDGTTLGDIDLSPAADTAVLQDNADGTFTLQDVDGTFGGDITFRPAAGGVTVNGLTGDDTVNLSAATFPVFINGGGGRDMLTGGTRNDILRGGSGRDTLIGFLGADTQKGGGGADVFIWNNGDGPDDNFGNGGLDLFEFNGADRNDVIALTRADEIGQNGDGTHPAADFDLTRTLPSPFTIENGEIEQIRVNGLAGADELDATDLAFDGLSSLVLNGGPGNDILAGSAADDELIGGPGRDVLIGFRGADVQRAGSGRDTFLWNNGDGPDDNVGGAGSDKLIFNGDRIAADIVNLTSAAATGEVGDGTLPEATVKLTRTAPTAFTIEMRTVEEAFVRGFGGDDELSSAAIPVGLLERIELAGHSGTDTLRGGPANETFSGGSGRDSITTGRGDNRADGGFGSDVFHLTPAGIDEILDEGGQDRLSFLRAERGVEVDLDLFDAAQSIDVVGNRLILVGSGIEDLTGSPFQDALTLDALSSTRRVDGVAGTDTLTVDPRGNNAEILNERVAIENLADILFSNIAEVDLP